MDLHGMFLQSKNSSSQTHFDFQIMSQKCTVSEKWFL